MLTSVFAKSVRDRTVTTLVTAGVLVFFAGFAFAIYSGFDDTVLEIFASMPDALAALYGVNDGTAAGLVTGALFAIIAPMILLVYAIPGGTGAAVGEERRKTLDLLLSNPVSRTSVLLSKAAVAALGIVLISAVCWLGSEGIAVAVDLDVGGQNILAASVQAAGLALMFGATALAISAWTANGAFGSGFAAAVAAISYLWATLLPVNEDLETLAKFTPWWLYSGPEPLVNGIGWVSLAVMLGIAAALVVIGVVGINRRDLRG